MGSFVTSMKTLIENKMRRMIVCITELCSRCESYTFIFIYKHTNADEYSYIYKGILMVTVINKKTATKLVKVLIVLVKKNHHH